VVEDAGLPGGVLQVDWDEHWRAFVAIVVDPTKRRRGLGKRLLRSFVDCHSQPFEAITGSVEPDNRASLALALRCGFEQIGVDDEGFVRLQSKKS
jgi:RimJ/RimL family protein N-acetyltransferase